MTEPYSLVELGRESHQNYAKSQEVPDLIDQISIELQKYCIVFATVMK